GGGGGWEGWWRDIGVRRGRIRVEMIRQVEDFRPEFEESSLVEPKRLVYREVSVFDTRQPNGIGTRRRAEAAEGRFSKGRRVEPTFPRPLVARQIGILSCNRVRPRADSGTGRIHIIRYRRGE